MSIHFVAGPNNKKLERSNDVALGQKLKFNTLGNTICTMYIYIKMFVYIICLHHIFHVFWCERKSARVLTHSIV